MVKYICEKCGKNFAQKSRYDSHKRRKTPCDYIDTDIVNKTVEAKLTSDIRLPNTRFQGSKKKIISTIYKLLIEQFKPMHILDLFGGSSICSLYFHMSNIEVTYNDLLKFNCINAYGFLHNDLNDIPSEDEIRNIFVRSTDTYYNTFITDTFRGIYYTDEENLQLDYFRENIKSYEHAKKNIMYYLLFQSLISKRPYNLFHRKNLYMRLSEIKRNFGNKVTWDETFINHMIKFRKELIKLYNQKKILSKEDTHIINMSYNDIPEEIVSSVDTIYIDPPYFKNNRADSQYFDNYHFLEGFVNEDWKSSIDYSTQHLKLKTTPSYIIKDANEMFDNIITKYCHKNLVISYNTNSFPTISDIEAKLRTKYQNVITKYIDYNYALSKKADKEVLILAFVT
jgi:adenine-specific DNA methylase